MYQIRVNAPNDDLISKGDFGVLPDQFGYGRKVVNLGGILITERGKYTVDIFEIGADNKLKFIKTKRLFNADYPPQREFSDAEKEADIHIILNGVTMTNSNAPINIQKANAVTITLEDGTTNTLADSNENRARRPGGEARAPAFVAEGGGAAVKHPGMTLDCDGPTDENRFYALAEEVGEVAASLTYDNAQGTGHGADTVAEVTQVGALALAWLVRYQDGGER